eukprot:m.279230 g.279230  ORF g.279230 m.279230 type:complete len:680 (+) comp19801_c0_seq5:291-2330(+)
MFGLRQIQCCPFRLPTQCGTGRSLAACPIPHHSDRLHRRKTFFALPRSAYSALLTLDLWNFDGVQTRSRHNFTKHASGPLVRNRSMATRPATSKQQLELRDFLAMPESDTESGVETKDLSAVVPPYVDSLDLSGAGQRVYFETYGCQMNVNDTEVAWAILQGVGYERAESAEDADVALLVTCAIRDNAEKKVLHRLHHLGALKSRRQRKSKHPQHHRKFDARPSQTPSTSAHGAIPSDNAVDFAASAEPRTMKIGVLGCMAERLKKKLLETEKAVDVVCGPDAYRDLPRLLADSAATGQAQINVQLSLDETYADVAPVRLHPDTKSAFVSVMRGCDNMCTYCIVPFTRGRERSRDVTSIVAEVRAAAAQGIREITLLGQNVNSYRYVPPHPHEAVLALGTDTAKRSAGFSTVYKEKEGGLRFADLLARVAQVDPGVRVRFTSPHPKDFPDALLEVMNEFPNVCNHVHMPAQSGSTTVLSRMGRGYARESYIALVERIRALVPGVTISSDFIAGFCGETDEEHRDTVSLLQHVRYDAAFLFAYSMRAKTRAYHRLADDVPEEVKLQRLSELIDVFHAGAASANSARIGNLEVVLVSGTSRRSDTELVGKTDGNTKLIFPLQAIPDAGVCDGRPYHHASSALERLDAPSVVNREPQVGDVVLARVTAATPVTLRGDPICVL